MDCRKGADGYSLKRIVLFKIRNSSFQIYGIILYKAFLLKRTVLFWEKNYSVFHIFGNFWKRTILFFDRTILFFDGTIFFFDGTILFFDGTILFSDGTILFFDGTILFFDGTIPYLNGTILLFLWNYSFLKKDL